MSRPLEFEDAITILQQRLDDSTAELYAQDVSIENADFAMLNGYEQAIWDLREIVKGSSVGD